MIRRAHPHPARRPVEVIHISRADWRQAYQDALRIAKNRDGEAALDAQLLNDPYVRSTGLALAAIADACGHSIRVPA